MDQQDQRQGTRSHPGPRGEAEGGGRDRSGQARIGHHPGQSRMCPIAESLSQDLPDDHQEPAGREDQGLQEVG
eukprot:15879369-Heterocapsa_arctica.AAC.1